MTSMLEPYRVLDLTDERGQLAGLILAALGAEVILVEPPDGSRSRLRGPWARDLPGPERSLSHWAANRGKQSVMLDLAGSESDRAELRRLAADADVLIESGTPGDMEALGLGSGDLAAVNPALVYVSISAFGQDGPKARWAATELTVWSSAMALLMSGDADRPPVRVGLPQAFLHAGADAAGGTLLALAERARSGRGQHVDVSAQQSSLQASQSFVLCAPLRSTPVQRMAGGARYGPLEVQVMWPCADGHVAITFLFGEAIGPFTHRFMTWICEEGYCDEATRDKDWVIYGLLLVGGQEPIEEYERVKKVVESFTLTKTKAELLEGALERRLLIAPVATSEDLATSDHFEARDYWDVVDDDELSDRPVRSPGPFAKASATPLVRLGRAPRIGEHTAAVLTTRRRRAATEAGALGSGSDQPLAGLKVLDFMWVMAGPAITRVLADYGATVVRLESMTHIDTARTATPFHEDVPDPERSALYWNMNLGKLGCAINISKPEARPIIEDLVRWADVVTESFSPRAMRQWNLDYGHLREINPSIVMLSSCLMGQTGPLHSFAGFGNLAAAIAGFFDLAGWPDRSPAGPFGAYTDYVSPRFGVAALLAALDHRRRTGEGQYIDLSQAEASIHLLAPALLDYTVNGRAFVRRGNADPHMCPHGIYPCEGDDQWVAIACELDDQWRALCPLIGKEDLLSDKALANVEGRLPRADDLDKLVGAWTSERSAVEATDGCQGVGVPAHPVQDSEACWSDPQLAHRGHFVTLEHATAGPITLEGSRIRLSRTPARVGGPPPLVGNDTSYILGEILGYDEDRIADLYALELLE